MARTSNRHFFAPVRRVATVAAAGALATGVLLMAAPAASAEPQKPIKESTIKSECDQAGGNYGSQVRGGVRSSVCAYNDSDGNAYIDHYTNGRYTYTT